ncbi:MAG: glycosyltransferase family 4 protein, partial [Thermoleophilaceae bacterium]|nr:glycosyltransferase family 4 protein [Thermoleophilaceae bacterium]
AGEVAAAPRVRDLANDDCLEIITVSRLDREKNPLLLVDIAAELRRLLPERRFRLRIVGDGPMSEQLAARIGEFELADCVELLGYVPYGPQLSALYNSSDIFLHVSHTEGLPQVLIEAMAHGVPLVATAVGGVVALLAGTEAAVVAPGDAVAAAQALTELATDKSLRLAGATAGLQRAAELTIEAQQSAVLAHFASMHDRLLA